jgi:hypothetical protein
VFQITFPALRKSVHNEMHIVGGFPLNGSPIYAVKQLRIKTNESEMHATHIYIKKSCNK